jgi:hypothetical protein
MDVEGAELESVAATSDEVLQNVDQIAMFQKNQDKLEYLDLIKKLKKTVYIARIYFNNHAYTRALDALFPSRAFQVLLVNKKVAILDEARKPILANLLDEKDNPDLPNCQNFDQPSLYQVVAVCLKRQDQESKRQGKEICGPRAPHFIDESITQQDCTKRGRVPDWGWRP